MAKAEQISRATPSSAKSGMRRDLKRDLRRLRRQAERAAMGAVRAYPCWLAEEEDPPEVPTRLIRGWGD